MVRLRVSWRFSLSSAPTVGNPCRPLQPETVSEGPARAGGRRRPARGHHLDRRHRQAPLGRDGSGAAGDGRILRRGEHARQPVLIIAQPCQRASGGWAERTGPKQNPVLGRPPPCTGFAGALGRTAELLTLLALEPSGVTLA